VRIEVLGPIQVTVHGRPIRLAGQRQRAKFEGAAIEEDCFPAFAMARNKLIHDAAARADKLVFGPLAEQSELGSIDFIFTAGTIGRIEEGIADRDFNRRGGTESGSLRHVAVD